MKEKRYLAHLINRKTLKDVWLDMGVETKEKAIYDLEHNYPYLELISIGEWKPETFRKNIMKEIESWRQKK